MVQLDDVMDRHPGVVAHVVDGEAVLVDPAGRKVVVLNGVGARLWELTDGQRSAAALAAQIADEYSVGPAQAQADVTAFYADLLRRGLLKHAG